ncbi:MAG: hypothetical protein PHQ80_02540 [Candidatus ainarchaeum sp.]|nr:hypothetical protein [Candidatus ainarchaeum sp.]MDD5096352.1 hypothetical protein [Candidatus ainarchaeum sp.]
MDSKQMRGLHAAQAELGRMRRPTSFEIGRFKDRLGELLDRDRPRIPLMLAIQNLTSSPAFSWFAASGVCRMLPPEAKSQSAPGHRMEVASSSLEFLFRIARSSPENACRAALSLRTLEGCRADNLLKFFKLLNDVVDSDPSLALHILGSYSCGPREPSLLGKYAEAISLLMEKGGAGPARDFAAIFFKVGNYPESARLLLDSMEFTATHLPVGDWGKAISSIREEWEKALDSEAFRRNPPD